MSSMNKRGLYPTVESSATVLKPSDSRTTGSENVAVTVRDLTVAGIATADQVTFTVPPSIAPNTDVTVAVERAGVRSDPITIHVA